MYASAKDWQCPIRPPPTDSRCGQGSILGPALLTLYVNDLLSVPEKCQAMGYVNDTNLLLALPQSDVSVAIPDLSSDLREIAKWCSLNSLLINPSKTKVLVVGVPQVTRNFTSCRSIGEQYKALSCCKSLGVLHGLCRNL